MQFSFIFIENFVSIFVSFEPTHSTKRLYLFDIGAAATLQAKGRRTCIATHASLTLASSSRKKEARKVILKAYDFPVSLNNKYIVSIVLERESITSDWGDKKTSIFWSSRSDIFSDYRIGAFVVGFERLKLMLDTFTSGAYLDVDSLPKLKLALLNAGVRQPDQALCS